MAIGYNLTYYGGKKIRDFVPGDASPDPSGVTYRFRTSYRDESGISVPEKIAAFAQLPDSTQAEAIVIGLYDDDGGSASPIIKALIEHREAFSGLRHIFFGDISYEENEMSWIQNDNMAPLLDAFPLLETFGVRGATGLGFAGLEHQHLKKLTVQTGGLGIADIREILAARLPALEHLELWLGSSNYGWDGTAEDLKILLDLPQFPNLKYLGLCNSEIADEIAAVLGDAPIFGQVEEFSLHNGNLADDGALALIANPALSRLKKLDLHHHYISTKVQGELKAAMKEIGVKVDLNKAQGAETHPEDRYIMVSE
jgi:hypothetical protein